MTALTAANRYRKLIGLPALTSDPSLNARAKARAKQAAEAKRLQHVPNPPGAELLTCGRLTDEGAIREWMESPTHRPHLLNGALTRAGFGSAEADGVTYWVGYLDQEPRERPKPEPPGKGKKSAA